MQEDKMITDEKRAAWLKHVEDWKKSGLSISKYCMENGINKSTFRYWIDRDKKKQSGNKLVRLKVDKPISEKEDYGFLVKYGKYEIEIPATFDKSGLSIIFDILEERVSC